MADGDVLTLVAGHQAFAAPTGGVLSIHLLTFHVAHDDQGADPSQVLDQSGIPLVELDPGVLVLDVAILPTETWEQVNGQFAVSLGAEDDIASGPVVASYLVNGMFSAPGETLTIPIAVSGVETPSARSVLAKVVSQKPFLGVYVSGGDSLPIEGEVDVFVLVGTPA